MFQESKTTDYLLLVCNSRTSLPLFEIYHFLTLFQLFGTLFSLGAIVFAANNNGADDTDDKSLGFAAIWMMLMVIGLSVGGTMVMRKVRAIKGEIHMY